MFEIGRIRLRPWEKKDLEKVHEWENDFSLMLYSRGKPHNMSSYEEVVEYYEKERKNEKRKHYIVELRENGEAVGTAVIRLEDWSGVRRGNLGTYLDKKYWNKGLGKEITLALLEISFIFMNLDKCEAGSIEFNKRAHKVLEECRFKKTGIMRKGGFVMGKRWDWYYFDILKEEYMEMRGEILTKILRDKKGEYLKNLRI